MGNRRIALALGSGGWKGIAHIGVLRALAEAEIRPTVFAGASAGALVAATAAQGMSLAETEALADRLRAESLFRMDFGGLLRRGRRAEALYQGAPLRRLCTELFGQTTLGELPYRLVVSTVEVGTGALQCWGSPTLPDAPVADAVYASCAIPGLLPPGRVRGRLCIDGAALDPLALGAVAPFADLVIAVVLDELSDGTQPSPAASMLWWHAHSIVMRGLSRHTLALWDGPPLAVLRLELRGTHPLRGSDPAELIQAGYEAAQRAVLEWEGGAAAAGEVHPLA